MEPTDETCNLSKLSLRDEAENKQSEVNHRSNQQQQQEAANQQQLYQAVVSKHHQPPSILRSQSYVDEGRLYRLRGQRKTSVYEPVDVSPSKNCQERSYRRSLASIHELILNNSPIISHHQQLSSPLTLLAPATNQHQQLQANTLNAREIVLRHCKQSEPLCFEDAYAANALRHCRKIGEGVYSEVFMNKSAVTGCPVVLKILPIEGDLAINGEPQKKFDEILSEIVIATELSNLRNGKRDFMTAGFVESLNVRCVKGKYPEHLLDLWELFRENNGTENDHPDIFDEDQLYIVLELANGGQDLEAFEFQNALQSYSAFLQVSSRVQKSKKKKNFLCAFSFTFFSFFCCTLHRVGVSLGHIAGTNHD